MQDSVLQQLAEIVDLLKSIDNKLRVSSAQRPDIEKWLDSLEVQRLLKISTSTLYRLKRKRILNPYQLGGRDYYDPAEIRRRRNEYLK